MHKFLRTLGFSKLNTELQLEPLLARAANERYRVQTIHVGDGVVTEEYQLPVAPSMGITLVGQRMPDGNFHREYYFPYMRSYDGTLTEEGVVERHLERETYAGVLEDYRSGIPLIFYVTNSVQLMELRRMGVHVRARQAFLSGLAESGTILLPVAKRAEDPEQSSRQRNERKRLYEAARQGDPEAIDTLTETEMQLSHEVQRRIMTEDLYSLVESAFVPTGVECDMYQVLGEIQSVRVKENVYTHENVVDMKLFCNDCTFHVAVNENDLNGVPAIGRRFKGKIWMQGMLEVMEEPEPPENSLT